MVKSEETIFAHNTFFSEEIYIIIDMHVHLSKSLPMEQWALSHWPGTQQFEHTAEQFLEKMENCNPRLDKALIFSFRSLHSESMKAMRDENDYILKTVEEYPDRFIGACLIDPSWDERAIKELNRVVKLGLRVVKVKFSSVHVPANSPLAEKIFREIEDLGILPVLHSDWSNWTNPSIIGDLIQSFPEVKTVMQHFGLSQSHEAMSVLRNNENLYVDTSAVIHPKNILRFIDEVSSDRIMFASDTIKGYEKTMPQEEMDRVLNMRLPDKVLQKTLGLNAEKLLKSVGVRI
jgi:predicted TIM-barrel fold metal-dependent hydrolase